MELIGKSTIWVEKYRPKTINDLIIPDNVKKLFNKFIEEQDIPNLLFASSAGRGKTSTAYALCDSIGADKLYINGSTENSIDTLRYKVTQFAMTSSFSDGGKVCIIDECERLSPAAQDGMKALIEQTESNCRFILTTNNISKIIDPIRSRCQMVDFNFNQSEMKVLIISYFKRLCWILDQEKIKYDRKVLAELVQKLYPDFRKTLNELQKFCKMYGEVTEAIFQTLDGAIFSNLIEEIRNKKFNNIVKLVSNIDPSIFYKEFYDNMDGIIEDQSKPTAVMILGRYSYETSLSIAPEISLCSCIVEIMKECQFK